MKHVAEYWYFLRNQPIKVKIRDPAKKAKNFQVSLLWYLKIMESSFIFVAQSDPESNFSLLRQLEAKRQ